MSFVFSGKNMVSSILQIPLITGQIIVGMVFIYPFMIVGEVCNTIDNAKKYVKIYYENKKLLCENPDHCIHFTSRRIHENNDAKDTIYILENDIFERANKHILLRTGKPVYLTEKSNRILPINFK